MFQKSESQFFYIIEKDLIELSKLYKDKPLAYVFYSFLKNNGFLKEISIDKCGNFFNRINFEMAVFEVMFSDGSIFKIGNGVINVSSSDIGFYYSSSA